MLATWSRSFRRAAWPEASSLRERFSREARKDPKGRSCEYRETGEALSDRPGFRRFCGFAREEDTPERTAFVRFRRELAARGLDQSLFEAITRDPEAKGACVRNGTVIDAAIIGPATKGDEEAAFVKHRPRAPTHGGFAHIAAGKDTGIIRAVEATAANEADGPSPLSSSPMHGAERIPRAEFPESTFLAARPMMRIRRRRRARPRACR
ncbi:MAG: transposase [Methylocella sp.]